MGPFIKYYLAQSCNLCATRHSSQVKSFLPCNMLLFCACRKTIPPAPMVSMWMFVVKQLAVCSAALSLSLFSSVTSCLSCPGSQSDSMICNQQVSSLASGWRQTAACQKATFSFFFHNWQVIHLFLQVLPCHNTYPCAHKEDSSATIQSLCDLPSQFCE